jgi:hypothetical protein
MLFSTLFCQCKLVLSEGVFDLERLTAAVFIAMRYLQLAGATSMNGG